MQPPAVGHEADIVLMRFAKADARIEADSLASDAGSNQRVAPLSEILMHFINDVPVLRLLLHLLRFAMHLHDAAPRAAFSSDCDHLRIAAQPRDIVDDL